MLVPRWLVWPIFALTMGFFIGGSVFWGLYGPNTTIEQPHASSKEESAKHTAAEEKEKADEALARYTFWLTIFTGVLAFATVGLGVATVGLYLTGEKQIRIARRTSVRQSREMEASIAAANAANELNRQNAIADRRPWLAIEELKFREPFVFHEGGASASFDFEVRNFGKSPAMKVSSYLEIHAMMRGGTSIVDEQNAFLKELLFRRDRALSGAVFPSGAIPQAIASSISQPEIDKATVEASFGKFIYFSVWLGVSYESDIGELYYTISRYWPRAMPVGGQVDLTINQMGTHAI